jgi:hypothetical protein
VRQHSTWATLQPLVDLNHALVMEAVERLGLARLTIDVDGSGHELESLDGIALVSRANQATAFERIARSSRSWRTSRRSRRSSSRSSVGGR